MHSVVSSIKRFDLSPQILRLNVQVVQYMISFEKLLSNNPLCFLEILHYIRSTICQPHILIRNSIVLPLTSLEIQVSHKLCRTKNFDHLIKAYIPTPRCLLQSIEGSVEFAQLLASLGLTKPSGCITYNLSSTKLLRKQCLDIVSAMFHK